MPSTYSPNLRIELIANGEQSGAWGTTTNNNLGTLIETAISGHSTIPITGASQALTALNGAADQSRNQVLEFTGSSGAFTVYIPPAEKTYIVYNNTLDTATIAVGDSLNSTTPKVGSNSITLPPGKIFGIWCDGTLITVSNNYATITGGSITGITDLAVADGGTGASDAPTARANLGLGTISVQNSNAVNITGGSITGITDLAVADGGTGASSFTSGALLKGNGTSAISPASAADIAGQIGATFVTNATNATNIIGGGANRIPYNTGSGVTSFVPAPTTPAQFLKYDGTTLTWDQLPASGVLSVSAVAPLASSGGSTPSISLTGVVPTANGGTGLSTIGSANQLLAVNSGGTGLTYVNAPSSGVTTFSAGTTGLTPVAATPGTVTLGGVLGYANGGTGQSSWAAGDMLYASTANNLAKLSTGGTANNGKVLTIAGGVPSWQTAGVTSVSGTTNQITVTNGTTTPVISLPSNVTISGTFSAGGDVIAYATSDARLKENVSQITGALDIVQKIRGVRYDWTEEAIEMKGGIDGYFVRKQDVGVIAQEVENVLPELVAEKEDGFKGVKYDRLVAVLIEAVKELQAEVADLKAKL